MGFATWNAVNPILLLKFLDKKFFSEQNISYLCTRFGPLGLKKTGSRGACTSRNSQ